MNYSCKLILCYLLLASSLVFSQQQEEVLIPFQDYAKCLSGLKNERGKIVWNAEFESLTKIYDRKKFNQFPIAFQAKLQGKFGLLSTSGKVMIPFEYDFLQQNSEGDFIVADHGKYGVINANNQILIEARYEMLSDYQGNYLFKQAGMFGLIDYRGTQLIPAIYDQISTCDLNYVTHLDAGPRYSKLIFRVRQNQLYGIYHLEKGEIIPPLYREIFISWLNEECVESEANYILSHRSDYEARTNQFQEQDRKKANLQIVANLNGQEIVSDTNIHSINFEYSQKDSCTQPKHQYVIIVGPEGKQKAYNLRTGTQSSEYVKLYFNRGYFRFEDETETGILDTAYQEIFRISRKKVGELWPPSYEISPDSIHEVLLCIQDQGETPKIGFVNVKSRKFIDTQYDQIECFLNGQNSSYWGIQYQSKKQVDRLLLAIYNQDLTKTKEFTLLEISPLESEQHLLQNRVYIVRLKNGAYGGIDIHGNIVIPFEYDSYHEENWNNCILLGKDFHEGLWDRQGKQIIPVKFKDLKIIEHTLIQATEDNGLKHIYTRNGELLLEAFSEHFVAPLIDRKNQPIMKVGAGKEEPVFTSYAVKNGRLYVLENMVFINVDEEHFNFGDQGSEILLANRFIIDREGRFIGLQESNINPPKAIIIPLKSYDLSLPHLYWKPKGNPAYSNCEWYLFDSLKRQNVSDETFESPVLASSIFLKKGKYGVLDQHMNIALPASYEYIYRFSDSIFLVKNGKWTFFNARSRLMGPAYDQVSVIPYKQGYFVWDDGKVGFVTKAGTLILPLREEKVLLETSNLLQFLEQKGLKTTGDYIWEGLIYRKKPSELARRINNQNLLELARYRSTEFSSLKQNQLSLSRTTHASLQHPVYYQAEEIIKTISPSYFSERYYSELRTVKQIDLKSVNYHSNERVYLNYHIKQKEFLPIQLNALLKSDEKSNLKLDSLLLKELTKTQALGMNCVSGDEILSYLKAHFLIEPSQLAFHLEDGTRIVLSYVELRDLLLDSKEFLEGE